MISFGRWCRELVFYIVQWILDFHQCIGGHTGVNFSCFCTGMPQQFLYIPEVGALLKEVGREAVSKAVGGHMFADAGTYDGMTKYLLYACGAVLCTFLTLEKPGARRIDSVIDTEFSDQFLREQGETILFALGSAHLDEHSF